MTPFGTAARRSHRESRTWVLHDESLESQFPHPCAFLLPRYVTIEAVFLAEYQRISLFAEAEAHVVAVPLQEISAERLAADSRMTDSGWFVIAAADTADAVIRTLDRACRHIDVVVTQPMLNGLSE